MTSLSAKPALPPKRRSGCLGRAALVLGSVLFTLALLEAGLHLIEARTGPLILNGLSNPEYNPLFVQPHPVLGVEHVRNGNDGFNWAEHPGGRVELRTNNLGLREDEDTPADKPAGVYRILVLGDSQTDGMVYNNESWANVLEQTLNTQAPRADGKRYEVLNAGVITYQPIHEYLWWRTYGTQLKPDLVVLGYYVGNDLLDAGGSRLKRTQDGTWRLNDSARPPVQPSTGERILTICRVCALIAYPLRGSPLEDLAAQIGLIRSAKDGRYFKAHRTCRGCVWQSLHQAEVLVPDADRYALEVASTEEILRRLQEDVQGSGAQLAVVVLPTKLQIEGDSGGQAAEIASILEMSMPNPPFEDRVATDVLALLDQHAITHLDARAALANAAGGGEPLYYAVDWHLNVKGNQVVGQALAAWLEQSLAAH